MKAPGTAYDDDVLGRDSQPAHMRDFVRTSADNGGVHINSGIPNRAFAAVAVALGGPAWERAGWIWYDTLTGGGLDPRAGFSAFAAATRRAARARFGVDSAEERGVTGGWHAVGIEVSPAVRV
ncbi:MAG TPA: M4 family metallopeptidase [Aldersonia sp.]